MTTQIESELLIDRELELLRLYFKESRRLAPVADLVRRIESLGVPELQTDETSELTRGQLLELFHTAWKFWCEDSSPEHAQELAELSRKIDELEG